MKAWKGLLVGLAMGATPLAAAEQAYLCAVKAGQDDGGWISADYALLIDAEAGKVVVNDGVIMHFNKGQPIDGVLVSSTAEKTVFTWSLFSRSASGQNTKMAYRAALFSQSLNFNVTARPSGYSNSFAAGGTCRPA